MRKSTALPLVIVVVTLGVVAYFGFDNSEKAVVEVAGKCVSTVELMWGWVVELFKLT
jgi:hypothetical protein